MKITLKLALAALMAIMVTYSSCKKADVKPDEQATAATISDEAMGKQLALNLYRTLSGKLGTGNIKTNGVTKQTKAVVSTGGIQCGDTDKISDGSTELHGDTTVVSTHNYMFTWKCNGYRDNPWGINAYLLTDTIVMKLTGAGFADQYVYTQDYDVRDSTDRYFKIHQAVLTASIHETKVNNANITTQFKMLNTQYHLSNITVERGTNTSKYIAGRTTFETQLAEKYPDGPVGGTFDNWSGFFNFRADDSIDAFIKIKNTPANAYMKFNVNLLTGNVTNGVRVDL